MKTFYALNDRLTQIALEETDILAELGATAATSRSLPSSTDSFLDSRSLGKMAPCVSLRSGVIYLVVGRSSRPLTTTSRTSTR
jgi:hypothetical protein